jgi:Zn finger protein HypA/HybF involved in hydrogenase expression
MSPVDAARTRSCIRCNKQFEEPAGTVTRICETCRTRSAGVYEDFVDGTVVNRTRERVCIRCGDGFTERSGVVTRLCPGCDSSHVSLD